MRKRLRRLVIPVVFKITSQVTGRLVIVIPMVLLTSIPVPVFSGPLLVESWGEHGQLLKIVLITLRWLRCRLVFLKRVAILILPLTVLRMNLLLLAVPRFSVVIRLLLKRRSGLQVPVKCGLKVLEFQILTLLPSQGKIGRRARVRSRSIRAQTGVPGIRLYSYRLGKICRPTKIPVEMQITMLRFHIASGVRFRTNSKKPPSAVTNF